MNSSLIKTAKATAHGKVGYTKTSYYGANDSMHFAYENDYANAK